MRNVFMACLLLGFVVYAQQDPQPDKNRGVELRVKDSKVLKVEPVLDPKTIVNFDQAHMADLNGKPVTIDLDRVTVVEYWSRNANGANLYWTRMRELENKYAGSPDFQVISINYDVALGGKRQREALQKYLKDYTVPKTLYIDRDDGIRDLFSLTGPIGYMLFNHHSQYIYFARGDDPTGEKLFEKIQETLEKKKKWDEFAANELKKNNVKALGKN